MKTLIFVVTLTLCACSTTEVAQTQAVINAANAALKSYRETPTK